jgi:hypothetical protein
MRLALAPSDTSALAYLAGLSGHGQEEKDMTGAGNESERAVSKRIDVPPEVEEVFRGFVLTTSISGWLARPKRSAPW